MIFWVSGDMSEDLRIKKLRGSGGFVIAQVTDEQQRKGNLGGPDLFLAPIGRLDVESVKKYTCNTCDKEYEGSPKIEYENPNEEVAEILIGKAGKTGLKQEKQIETVQRFRDGITKALVATRVGEEGLDISEVNLVIFYDNVPSSIRFIQRKGRTGRKDVGRLVVLIAKDTIDEAYYWIGKRKVKLASNMADKITKHLEKTEQVMDDFF